MMGGLDKGPLTDEEIEELDQFLLDADGIEESMNISMLDGFLTAIVSGPKTIMPSEWIRWVWDIERGEDKPACNSIPRVGCWSRLANPTGCRPSSSMAPLRAGRCSRRETCRWTNTEKINASGKPGAIQCYAGFERWWGLG
jgi:hypothetical protein